MGRNTSDAYRVLSVIVRANHQIFRPQPTYGSIHCLIAALGGTSCVCLREISFFIWTCIRKIYDGSSRPRHPPFILYCVYTYIVINFINSSRNKVFFSFFNATENKFLALNHSTFCLDSLECDSLCRRGSLDTGSDNRRRQRSCNCLRVDTLLVNTTPSA